MSGSGQPINSSNNMSGSSMSECNSLVIVQSQKRRLSEINDSASLSLLEAQKLSTETALKESQITSERDLKRARKELQSLESEKASLVSRVKILELRLTELNKNNESLKVKLQQVANEGVEEMLKSCRQDEDLNEKIDALQFEVNSLKNELTTERNEKYNLKLEMQSLSSNADLIKNKLAILQNNRDEYAAGLREAEDLKSKFNILELENRHLKDQLEQALHGPGNASSLLNRIDASGLCPRSSSILYSTRLEQRVAQLEKENAELQQSKSQLATTLAELEDLKAALARANEWRDRALVAEEKLSNGNNNALHASLEDAQINLAHCQQENALAFAEIGNLRSELSVTSIELKRVKAELASLQKEMKCTKTAADCLQSRFRRQSLRVTVLENERNMYKQFVDSYADADATLASPAGEMVHTFQDMVDRIAVSLNEFYMKTQSDDAELENIISELDTLASEVRELPIADVSSADRVLAASERRTVEQLRGTIRELEERLVKVESEKQLAQREVEVMRAQGSYNPDETQVLHIIDNPAEQARAKREDELITLRKENASLLQRVKILKERMDRLYEQRARGDSSLPDPAVAPGDITMAVAESLKDHPDPISEIRRLQAERQAEDRRHKKLMERFGELSSELREACALLFGFGLYLRQSGVYKVVPLHAPFDAETYAKSSKATEFIKFKRNGDTLTVMETTMKDEVVADFMSSHLPIPLALARLLLHVNGVRDIGACEESTMLM